MLPPGTFARFPVTKTAGGASRLRGATRQTLPVVALGEDPQARRSALVDRQIQAGRHHLFRLALWLDYQSSCPRAPSACERGSRGRIIRCGRCFGGLPSVASRTTRSRRTPDRASLTPVYKNAAEETYDVALSHPLMVRRPAPLVEHG